MEVSKIVDLWNSEVDAAVERIIVCAVLPGRKDVGLRRESLGHGRLSSHQKDDAGQQRARRAGERKRTTAHRRILRVVVREGSQPHRVSAQHLVSDGW